MIVLPVKCPYCGAARSGVQEGRVYFKCETTAFKDRGRWRVQIKLKCLEARGTK